MSDVLRKATSAPKSFILFGVFLGLVFLLGGASRIDVQSLLILGPLSVVTCALALLTLRREHLAGRKWLMAGFAGVAMLCALHLIPLPPAMWHGLPGRTFIAEIDALAGIDGAWRPITLTPMNNWHALASLATPLAVLLLGVQQSRDNLFRLLPMVLVMGGIGGLVGMMQVIGDPRGPLYFYNLTNHGSAVGFFANRNHAAMLLVMMFPMLAVYASVGVGTIGQQRMRQAVAVAAGIVLVPLVLVTGSRTGLILALPALACAAMLYRKPVGGRPDRRTSAQFKLSFGHLVAAGGVVSLTLLTIIFSRATAIERLFERSAVDDARADYWAIGLEMVWKYFPVGSGIGSFVEAYQIEEPDKLLQATYVNHMHNDWLETALTGGLPAIVLFAVAAIFFARAAFRLWFRQDPNRRFVKFGRLGSLLILLMAVASFADYPLRTPVMMTLFAIACLWLTAPSSDDPDRVSGVTGAQQ